tara:strand:+ start:3971 stop:4525 length:555 start_codon:yes stop_codon:yes gene_type:complete
MSLETDIKEAFEESMGTQGGNVKDILAPKLSIAIKEFLKKQEFRVVEMEIPIDVVHIKTQNEIAAHLDATKQFDMMMVYVGFFKECLVTVQDVEVAGIKPFAPIVSPIMTLVNKLEEKIKKVVEKKVEKSVIIPPLHMEDGHDGGDLDVKGNAVLSEKIGNSPTQKSKKTVIKLFQSDIQSNDK